MPLVGLLTSALHYNVRRAFKVKHGISDVSCCPEFAYLVFCDACMLCQELREMDLRSVRLVVMPPTVVVAPPTMQMNPIMQQPVGYEPKAI